MCRVYVLGCFHPAPEPQYEAVEEVVAHPEARYAYPPGHPPLPKAYGTACELTRPPNLQCQGLNFKVVEGSKCGFNCAKIFRTLDHSLLEDNAARRLIDIFRHPNDDSSDVVVKRALRYVYDGIMLRINFSPWFDGTVHHSGDIRVQNQIYLFHVIRRFFEAEKRSGRDVGITAFSMTLTMLFQEDSIRFRPDAFHHILQSSFGVSSGWGRELDKSEDSVGFRLNEAKRVIANRGGQLYWPNFPSAPGPKHRSQSQATLDAMMEAYPGLDSSWPNTRPEVAMGQPPLSDPTATPTDQTRYSAAFQAWMASQRPDAPRRPDASGSHRSVLIDVNDIIPTSRDAAAGQLSGPPLAHGQGHNRPGATSQPGNNTQRRGVFALYYNDNGNGWNLTW